MSFWRRLLGNRGERAAQQYLRKAGWKIIASNFCCPAGEIDIIADNGMIVAFVEVRTRSDDIDVDWESVFPPAKRRQVEQVARYWLARHAHLQRSFRFDAILILNAARDGSRNQIHHVEDAFRPHRQI